MKKLLFMLVTVLFASCQQEDEIIEYGALHWQVTMLLPDNGLGDEGLFDRSLEGVMNFVDEVGVSSVDAVVNIPYDKGDSDYYLSQWMAGGASTTVSHRLLFCPMASVAQCQRLASAPLADGDEVLIVCGSGKVANELQQMDGIVNDNRFHVYVLDTREAGQQAASALAKVATANTEQRKPAVILTTEEGLWQNDDLIEGFKEGVRSVTGQDPLVRVTAENTDSAYQVSVALAKEYACVLPATCHSNYGIYCALMDKVFFHTLRLDGVKTPVALAEDISIDRDMKTLVRSLLAQWRKGQTLEHLKYQTISCER